MPHIADVLLEAWGPTRVACLQEVACGLVESFADLGDVEPIDRIPVSLGPVGDEDVLVLLLEEVIYVVDALGRVPVGVELAERPDGSVEGCFATIPSEDLEAIGALPKGVSRSDLLFERRNAQWRCRVLVDV